MTQPTSLPQRTLETSPEDHLADHQAIHSLYSRLGGGQRVQTTHTTASLAPGARESTTLVLAWGYRLYRLSTTRPARVRLYATAAQRDADAARLVTAEPTGDHGLMLEYVTSTGALSGTMSPVVDGFDGDATPDMAIPITVDNLDSATGTVGVTFTYVRTE